MIRLVASDIDGTMVGENNILSQKNVKAIQDMEKADIPFTICTGKPYVMVKDFCQGLQANYGIFGNGNQIVNLKTGEEIFRKTLLQEEVDFCLALAKQKNLHIHIYTENEVITPQLLYMDLRNFMLKDSIYPNQLKFKIVSDIANYIKDKKPTIFKLIISSPFDLSEIEKEIKENTEVTVYQVKKSNQFKDKIINKEYEYLDITPSNTNKKEALEKLTQHLKLSSSEVMAIGDNLNDLEMLKNSGIGVAVANAYDDVKKVATYITENTVENSGFAEAVYKYISFE